MTTLLYRNIEDKTRKTMIIIIPPLLRADVIRSSHFRCFPFQSWLQHIEEI